MNTNVKQVSSSEVDERLSALITNSNAIQAIASAVEGTLGPKGLNCMLVDRFGDVTITNDGSAILHKIDVNHPAAKMVINTAKAQEEEVGDGTTTATVLASVLVSEGVKHIARGVPVTKIIEGIRQGLTTVTAAIEEMSISIKGLRDPLLKQAAFIAGRENEDIAELAVKAARVVGRAKLFDSNFKLCDAIVAKEGAQNEVVKGVIINKERLNKQMPRELREVKVLVVDDALQPEELEDDALGTEAGFQKYMELRNEFRSGLQKLIQLGVGLMIVDGGVDDLAEELLTDAGVMVVRRVSSKDIAKIVEHTQARTIKRSSLNKPAEELEQFLGQAARVYEDERLEHIRILGGKGKPTATIVVGASTEEVRDERERIAKDAASAVQASVRGGVVPGGGAAEIAAIPKVEALRDKVKGMAAYGVDCVIEALKKPLTQIVANAGFNPLEKVEDIIAAQIREGKNSLGVECNAGEVADMLELGIVDPTPVKTYALKASAEIAEAILRINTIIRKKDESPQRGEARVGSQINRSSEVQPPHQTQL